MQTSRRRARWLPWSALAVILVTGILTARGTMNDAKADEVFSDSQAAALATAAARGDGQRIRELVKQGANPDAHGDKGVNLLEWALLNKSTDGLKALLDAGANPAGPGLGGATVVHMAAKANDPAYLEILLDHGADPDTVHTVTRAPVLDAALMNPDNTAFELLLKHHADPNLADRLGNTPLHVAAQAHKSGCVLQLLQAGANPELRNQRGDTFQTYFNILPAGGLNAEARQQHDKVHAWLREHGVAVLGNDTPS